MTVDIDVLDDPARACSAIMVGAAAGGGHIVLTGGSTPRTAYEEFVSAVISVGIDVTRVHLWFGDERCVSPDDERSNFRMVGESLLSRLRADHQPTVHRMPGELGPHAAADAYERELADSGPAHFDLLLLGLGRDGHIASLFPDQPTLGERSRRVVGVDRAALAPFVPRVSLTLPTIAAARKIVFLVAGASKADAVAAAFGSGSRPDPHVPASLLPALADDVAVLLDPPAAARL